MSWKTILEKQRVSASASKGFSLIEVMIALVISGLVLVGVFAFSGIARTTTQDFRRDVRIQQSLEGAMHAVGQDVRIAGLGFASICNEIRINHRDVNRYINPSAGFGSGAVNAFGMARDADTEEPFWVLRDGFQAHWRSANSGTPAELLGDANKPTSAARRNHADSFDVVLGEPGYVSSTGAFRTTRDLNLNEGLRIASFATDNRLDPNNGQDLRAMRQLFFPGSFVLLIPTSAASSATWGNEGAYKSCDLFQVTGDVRPGTGGGGEFLIPTDNLSGFNDRSVALDDLADEGPTYSFTTDSPFIHDGLSVVPLGRLRWSRYEIDYSVPTRPYLVRTDLIGWAPGDPAVTPNEDYPACGVDPVTGTQQCQLPQLHVNLLGQGPGQDVGPPRTPIAPMIEDMQVAVGCDGYVQSPGGYTPLFEEAGGRMGLPNDGQPNNRIDEYAQANQRFEDEWAGNAVEERDFPDCAYWGVALNHRDQLLSLGLWSEDDRLGGWKMAPQAARITLLGKYETEARGAARYDSGQVGTESNSFYNVLFSIEDRQDVKPLAGAREYHTITEQFYLRNTKYRDPAFP